MLPVGDSAPSPSSGGRSAIYDHPYLRLYILELLDKATLAKLLRVEKGLTTVVAGLLYKEVTEEQADKMSRDDRFGYLASYLPKPPDHLGRPLHPGWRRQIHGPPGRGRRTARAGDFQHFDIYTYPDPIAVPPFLLPTPVLDGVDVHHVICITLVDSDDEDLWGDAERDDALDKWKEWLYRRPLDPRVVSVDHHSSTNMPFYYEDSERFVAGRSANGREPLRSVFIPDISAMGTAPSAAMENIYSLIPGGRSDTIREVAIEHPLVEGYRHLLQLPILHLGRIFPQLELLTLFDRFYEGYPFSDAVPLAGLPRLRDLTVYCYGNTPPLAQIALHICQLGGPDCRYRLISSGEAKISEEEFSDLVTAAKLSPPMVPVFFREVIKELEESYMESGDCVQGDEH